MPKIPLETQKQHIERFIEVQPLYKTYADLMEKILKKAVNIYAPLGIVQTREKSVDSFSEKIIRKDKYQDPLVDMTDLCGARVITHFTKQVVAICQFLEENFEVDRENSLDVRTRLKISEFGYRSIHYIVTPRQPKILGVDIPQEIRNLKAEVQVRTLHEHSWADILHDRMYKTDIKISNEWKRESARLAAILEKTDDAFGEMSDTIDQLAVNYTASPTPDKVNKEIEILRAIINIHKDVDEKKAKSHLKLARIYNSLDRWKESMDLIEPLLKMKELEGKDILTDLQREWAYASIHKNLNEKDGSAQEGLSVLKEVIRSYESDPSKSKELAFCYNLLAQTEEENRLENLEKAYKHSRGNPYAYASLMIEQFAQNPDYFQKNMDLYAAQIANIVMQCEKHIELGIEVSDALMTIGKLEYLRKNFSVSMNAYITLMRIVMMDEVVYSGSSLIREIGCVEKIMAFDPFRAGNILVLLHLMIWRKFGSDSSKKYLERLHQQKIDSEKEVLIFCGKSLALAEREVAKYSSYILEALREFNGTVISGGTKSGLPGLVGTLAGSTAKQIGKAFTLLGYLPENKEQDKDYDTVIKTKGTEYSILEALSYWADILLSGVDPVNVFLVGIHGGTISSMEYKLGLILGAHVCLVGKLGGTAADITVDPGWKDAPNLLNIPDDPLTIWALLNQDKKGILSEYEINDLAPKVHEYYRQKRRKNLKPETETDINKYRVVMKWDKLAPPLKLSNIKQVAFMEHILNRGGLKLQKSKEPQLFIIHDGYPTLEDMARLEHARWNAERLLDGWQFGEKDIMRKTTPFLIPWDELDDETKTYDFDPIKDFPELVLKIGYEVVEENK